MVFKWLTHLKSRRAIAFGLGGLLPIGAITYFFFLLQQGRELDQKIVHLEKKVVYLSKQKQQKDRFFRELGSCDPHFIQTTLEPLPLMAEELELLMSIESSYEPLQKRVASLTENKMHFVKGEVKLFFDYSETMWRLEKPVEVSGKDVSAILALIEGVRPLRPQLGIQKFVLTPNGEHYTLDLEILQYAKN